ncbi:nucleoside/nucleotide kinase family protein [Streptomyces sp. CB01881]|uniref:nucleoside/nucleotide kinase family protein n=1 Tax=Streptomyces sp. CB01881 TaxID=2078691 RepID=UPI000CDC9F97|nr:nucleoside/nucleotide kinase family protein [Streptomyces sp. CB01881]AUY51692.1 nucleoside/nucleotide kinase family protein [Streptomyces sp. CB01881]TYC71120.1 nucleoside/nucleotide kinase family protein [Streptomyces sp. CB01881]
MNEDTHTAPDLAALALGLLRGPGSNARTILGLAGPPGAGKSTLARHLVAEVERHEGPGSAAYLPLDGFHLSAAQLGRLGLSHRKGAPATFDAHGYVALLRRVASDRFQDIYAPDFDRELDEPVAARHVVAPYARLVITEGNYLAATEHPWPEARRLLRELWYVDAEDTVREERLLRRHRAGGRDEATAQHWVTTNDHPNGEYVKTGRSLCTRIVRVSGLPATQGGRSVL